uniref:Uncharacterized protein n=1 Tax=Mesocestoides corti TaxID=53468 RepID=A0A5K3G7J8_MESCO
MERSRNCDRRTSMPQEGVTIQNGPDSSRTRQGECGCHVE